MTSFNEDGRDDKVLAYTWGDAADSRLGGVDVRRHHTPQPIKTLEDALQRLRLKILCTRHSKSASIVSCGVAHTLVLTAGGQLVAWGCATHGQLGYGDLWDREDPVVVPVVKSVVSFSAGDRHTVAVTQVRDAAFEPKRYVSKAWKLVYTWGFNSAGELGLGDERMRLQPTHLSSLSALGIVTCAAGSQYTVVLASRESPNITKLASGQRSLRYCLDTVHQPADETHRRYTYETVVFCSPCRQKTVCRACARLCHGNHKIRAVFMRWEPRRHVCECAQSGSCQIMWSQTRNAFDKLAEATTCGPTSAAQMLHMRHFRELLSILHPGEISEDDIDSGEVALHSTSDLVTWDQFLKWYDPYFKSRQGRG